MKLLLMVLVSTIIIKKIKRIIFQNSKGSGNLENVGKTTFTFNTAGLNWDFPN